MQYAVGNLDFNVKGGKEGEEINTLKIILSVVIFSLPTSSRDGIIKSLSEINDPSVQKVLSEILQLSPENAIHLK